MRYIGDVHGKFDRYKSLISSCSDSVQVGDMGVGFYNPANGRPSRNPPYDDMVKGNHRFIRGNHDNPSVCRTHSQYIQDGCIEPTPKGSVSMYIGGALSIDKEWRYEGFDWWPDEELTIQEFNTLIDIYEAIKPEIMITHDCPESISDKFFLGHGKINIPSRTRQAFETMWNIHKPKLWIFGHWHISKDESVDDCRFICLAELQHIDLDV